MKTLKNWCLLGLSLSLLPLLAMGCSDTLSEPDDIDPSPVLPADGDCFMALRVYNASAVEASSRAGDDGSYYHDSDNGSYSQGGQSYDIGLLDENAIYTGYSGTSAPHFLLIFGEDKPSNSNGDKLEFLLPLFNWDKENGTDKDTGSDGTTSGYKSFTTFYTSAKKSEVPESFADRKVLVVLNASSALQSDLKAALTAGSSYDQCLGLAVGSTSATSSDYLYFTAPDGKPYLTMSSSMVVYNKSVEGTSSLYHGPSVFTRSNAWQATKELATSNPVYTLFVERLQSKFTVTFQDYEGYKCYFASEDDSPSDSYRPVTSFVVSSETSTSSNADAYFTPAEEWQSLKYVKEYHSHANSDNFQKKYIKKADHWKINITGWNVNATERREYLFKHLASPFSYYTGWNDPNSTLAQYRNFWAEDFNYSSTSFPDQYRPLTGLVPTTQSDGSTNIEIVTDRDHCWNSSASLNYFSYNSLASRSAHQYAPENTLSTAALGSDLAAAFSSHAFLRAASHIIVTAQLLIHGMDDNLCSTTYFDSNGLATDQAGTAVVESKFFMNDIFWNKSSYLEYVQEYLGYWMQQDEETFGKNDGIFYVSNVENQGVRPVANSTYFNYESANVRGGDGWVHIIPNLDELLSGHSSMSPDEINAAVVLYSRNPDTGVYRGITRRQFEILALSHPEYFAQHFKNGRMYYAVPVIHQQSGSGNIYLGKYGNVRNHWYSFNVTSFSAPGNPVDLDSQPIVPNNERSYETLGVTISVLPWHVISSEVDIQGQRPTIPPDEIDIDLQIKADDWNHSWSDPDF